jgi:uncharacterized protein YecE (DUF72 family)
MGISIELCNISWLDEAHAQETLAFLRELGVVHTIVDEPQGFTNSVPPNWQTCDEGHALVRMHRRNAMTWNASSGVASTRLNCDHNERELEALGRQILRLDRIGMQVHVVLNNNAEDQARRNGRTLMELMLELGADVLVPTASAQLPSPQGDWIGDGLLAAEA